MDQGPQRKSRNPHLREAKGGIGLGSPTKERAVWAAPTLSSLINVFFSIFSFGHVFTASTLPDPPYSLTHLYVPFFLFEKNKKQNKKEKQTHRRPKNAKAKQNQTKVHINTIELILCWPTRFDQIWQKMCSWALSSWLLFSESIYIPLIYVYIWEASVVLVFHITFSSLFHVLPPLPHSPQKEEVEVISAEIKGKLKED